MGVAKLLVSLVTLSLCVAQKSFTSTSQELLFIFQYSPWAELPKWCFSTEKEEREKRGWCGWEERKENARQKWKEGRRRKRDGVGAGGLPSLYCSAVFCIDSRKWILFHKAHERSTLFHLVCLTSAESIHSLISRATHENTHKEAVRFKLFWFRKNAVLILKW